MINTALSTSERTEQSHLSQFRPDIPGLTINTLRREGVFCTFSLYQYFLLLEEPFPRRVSEICGVNKHEIRHQFPACEYAVSLTRTLGGCLAETIDTRRNVKINLFYEARVPYYVTNLQELVTSKNVERGAHLVEKRIIKINKILLLYNIS